MATSKLLIINEMGYRPDRDSTILFQHVLKSVKFKHIEERILGFDRSEKHIGYLKLPDSELAEIEHNHQTGIKKFCDNLNIDINPENSHLLSAI